MKKFSRTTILLLSFLLMASCTQTLEQTTGNPPVIPMPAEAVYHEGHLDLRSCSIAEDQHTGKFADLLSKGIREVSRIRLKESEEGNIQLLLNDLSKLPEEGYLLQIDDKGIRLEAKAEAGLFYGIQTLIQMTEKDGNIRKCTIRDYPSFRYRGLHLDVSRHYMSVDYIKHQLELMSEYKFNRFHWHLVDGGGWRFESKKYPLLTQFAQARTKSDWIEWWKKGDQLFVETGTPGSYGGFYTQEEMREIVEFAQERYITIIPEIELPGHSNEVFFAYPELTCKGEVGSWEYCMGNPDVFTFLFDILDEVMDIFPSEYIHIGGDETKKTEWKECPKCQALMKKEGLKDVDELQSWCIHKVEEYLNSKGRNIIGWDEILQGGLAPNATVMSWRGEKGGKTAAQMHHNVIMTPGKPLYFDHYQAAPANEPKAIGGYNTIEHVYAYNPRPADLTEEEQSYILGAQANLWTEYVPDEAHAQYMTWPRALALAEVNWTPAEKKDYVDFLTRANIHTYKLKKEGVNVFPLKNVSVSTEIDTLKQEVRVQLKKENMRAEVHYTVDGSRPGLKSPIYESPIVVKDSASIRFCPFIGKKALTEPVTYDTDYHRAIGKKVSYNCVINKAYPAEGETTLTDGKRGTWTYRDNLWQGFTKPMDVTIDLGNIQPIKSVKVKFMQVRNAWVFMPKTVQVFVSQDGENFQSIGVKTTCTDIEDLETKFEDFKFDMETEARFIRMKAELSDEGGFIFTDEIRVF